MPKLTLGTTIKGGEHPHPISGTPAPQIAGFLTEPLPRNEGEAGAATEPGAASLRRGGPVGTGAASEADTGRRQRQAQDGKAAPWACKQSCRPLTHCFVPSAPGPVLEASLTHSQC